MKRHLSKFAVVVEMTSQEGNRYERSIEVNAGSPQAARALAVVAVEEGNKEYHLRARTAVPV